MTAKIPYTKPSITDLEISYVTDATANGWGERCYDYINRFERDFCEHLDVKYAIATSSCTGALHLGLAALGIGPGDEVILADTNWIASVAPVVHLGATPVFVDILPNTWCIDPSLAEAAITPRTKAIMAVHLYGNLCDMDRLLALGQRSGIPVIEDAAEAIGSRWKEQRAGSMGTFGAFSFHGTKTLTTGEGGMFVTNDDELYEKVLTLSNHGRSRNEIRQFWPSTVGFKFKISNIQAALGCAQLERVEDLVTRKREIFGTYEAQLAEFVGLSLNQEQPNTTYGYWMPTVVFDEELGVSRENLRDSFFNSGIDARVFFHPLSSLDIFESAPRNANAYSISSRAINLPSYHEMNQQDLDRVVSVIQEFLR